MTSEELRSRYQVLQRVGREGSVATHLAVAPSQMVVMIHFLAGPEEESRDILARVDRLTEPDRARVLDVTQVDGSWVIITKFLAGGQTVREWLDSLPLNQIVTDAVQPASPQNSAAIRELSEALTDDGSASDAAAERVEPRKAAADRERHVDVADPPGEFTRLFQAVDRVNPPAPAEPVARKDEVPDRVARQQTVAAPEQPGEFTRLFSAVDKPAAAPVRSASPPPMPMNHVEPIARLQPNAAVDVPPPPAAEVLPPRAPDVVPQPAAELSRAKPAPATQPGEFTNIFQSMGRAQSQPTSESAERLTSRPDLQPGVFGSAPFASLSSQSYLDKLEASLQSQTPHRPANIDPFALPGSDRSLPGSPPAPHQAAGPSEYTRVIAGMAAAPPRTAVPLATPVAPPPPAPVRSALPVLFGIVLIVVLAVAMVVFFALKTR
jgi:hypothetical protein